MKTATKRWMTLSIVLLLAAAGPAPAQDELVPAVPKWKPAPFTADSKVLFTREGSDAFLSAKEMYSRVEALPGGMWVETENQNALLYQALSMANPGMMSEKQSEMLEEEMPRVHEAVKALAALEGNGRRGRSAEGRRVVRDLLRKASELKGKNPARYEEEKPSLEIAALAQLTDLETEVRAAGVRGTPQGAEREKLAAELRASLEKALDLKEQVKAHEAELIERELQAIRTMLELRRRNRAQILERRLLQLLDEDELAW